MRTKSSNFSHQNQELPKWFFRLDAKDQSIVKRHLKRKIPFLSGTMAPAGILDNNLESIWWALDYYRNAGIKQLVMQPKYMGSRAQFEIKRLSLDDFEVRFISRGGYPISLKRVEGLDKLEDAWFRKLLTKFPNLNYILVDGELCPWSALGEGLIEKSFKPLSKGLLLENFALSDAGFDSVVDEVLARIPDEFPRDLDRKDKSKVKAVVAEWGHVNYQTWSTLLEFQQYRKDFLTESLYRIWLYERQVEFYGYKGTPSFEPFQVLKLDDQVLPFNNHEGFFKLSSRPCKLIDLEDSKSYGDVEKLFDCWQKQPEWFGECQALEGVVIKPLDPKLTDVAPYIKVRNTEYLRMVYGPYYDHPLDYQTLLDKKRLGKKLKLSIKEWELGLKMLALNSETFSLENEEALSLFVDFMRSEFQLKSVDPRL